uniref:B-cell receptor-associated protein n=1 Tax=Sus scrofa TaxID=9823 RepID=A0A8D1A1S2_PIG
MFLPPVPLGLEESPRSVNSLWGGAVNHSGGRGQLPAPSFPSCCQIQMPVAFCLAALATPRDRSRPEAGVGWEQPREVHASLFLPLPFAHFSLLFVNISSLLRRLVTLISQQATLLASNEAFKKQAESASEAAKKYMEENDQLKKEAAVGGVKLDGGDAGGKVEEENRSLKAELKRLKEELAVSKQKLEKAENEALAMRKQSEGLTKEYDRLLEEHTKLQAAVDGPTDKKEE